MKEEFLHFVWETLNFTTTGLRTTGGEELSILHRGSYNIHSGPDFLNGSVLLQGLKHFGHIELHVCSSDWQMHGHSADPAYDNVILHVVWEDDQPVVRRDLTRIPTIELRNLVSRDLMNRSFSLLQSLNPVPCRNSLPRIDRETRTKMLALAFHELMENKSRRCLSMYQKTSDWEETAYCLIARNIGFSTNAEAFQRLSELMPFRILARHSENLFQLEALLFGTAGFLSSNDSDAYRMRLRKEYEFLAHKYQLVDQVPQVLWRFMRMRPSNFPTLRIAQLAALIHHRNHLFSSMINLNSPKELYFYFQAATSEYWKHHYRFGKHSTKHSGMMGRNSVDRLMGNSIAVLLWSYSIWTGTEKYKRRTIHILEKIGPESNRQVRLLRDIFEPQNDLEAKSLLGLLTEFCQKKRCLYCTIGRKLISTGS